MKLSTHNRTPIPKNSKFVVFLLFLSSILIYGMFCLAAFACVFYEKDMIAGILVILIPIFLTTILFIQFKDIKNAYVEINGNSLHVADYYFGIKKEKNFSVFDITSAEIVLGYSPRIKGYRIGVGATTYIVFKNGKKYLFKIICVPETKEVFKHYINN